ncbi:MAG: PD-(D/E)XK nuclease family protein [Candidatus Heimdallarchaeaceae archaeon]
MNRNIFSVLAKYNSAKDENYLTEAFVYILQSLYESDRNIFFEIIERICVKGNEYNFLPDEKISITTQESTDLGRPDIKITTPDKLIYIEVKHDSLLGREQIERYLQILDNSSSPIKKLILLTRFSIEFTEQEAKPYKNIRWFEIYNWLSNVKPTNIVNKYLVLSFLKFLEEKQMSVKKVTWEYMNGVPALKNLMNMIEVAIESTSLKIASKSAGWDWMGYYIGKKKLLLWYIL